MHPLDCVEGFMPLRACQEIPYSYQRGSSALLVQQYRAMREASMSGTGSRTVPTLSFYAVSHMGII